MRVAIGIEADEIGNQPLFSLFHPDDAHDLKKELVELMKDQDEMRCQLRLRYNEGDYRPTDFHIIYNKGFFYLAGREAPDTRR